MAMVELTDKTINEYIETTLTRLPENIQKGVSVQYVNLKQYIHNNTPKTIKFIDCINVYIFAICLINVLQKLSDITPILDYISDIFLTINTYLYKKQYKSEKSYVSYEPDTKIVVNSIINNKQSQLSFIDSEITPPLNDDKNLDSVSIPKFDMDIKTEAKLLKTTGLMNPEIAKLIGDGNFNNVVTLPLANFSLSNQFVIKCRKSQSYKIFCTPEHNISEDGINETLYYNFIIKAKNEDKNEVYNPVITKYYLIYFRLKDNKLTESFFLLNSIAHLEFRPGYLANLKRMITAPLRERYVFTLGTFKGFTNSVIDVIGSNHRCALIFDKQEKHIYFFDTLLENANALYMFDKYVHLSLDNSIITACKYKFGSLDFIKTNGYKFILSDIKMQYHDAAYSDIITASTYYRYYGHKKHNLQPTYMDWAGGYCGTYMLLLLVMMSINPYLDISKIFWLFSIIADGSDTVQPNHDFLIALIRSFAYQIENVIYKAKPIQIDSFDFKTYMASEGKTIKLNVDKQFSLHPGMYAYDLFDKDKHINIKEKIKTIPNIFLRESNKATLIENKEDVIGKGLPKIYLDNTSLMFTAIGAIFKKINKMQTDLTQEQRQWQFDHYGPDDIIYFIKY